jgi:sugar phosphate isomerase/epimerase
MLTRRTFSAAAGAAALAAGPALRIGVMDTVLRMPGNPEAIDRAAALGFDGIQVTLGRAPVNGRLPLSDPALQREHRDRARARKIALASTYLDILHVNCLKNDAQAVKWAAEGIEITRALGAPVLMLVFFGKCALETRPEMDAVVPPLKELAPLAEKAGVVLGFENTISGADNRRILDQVGSRALQVWYDIGNSTNVGGFDVPAEIRALGRARICQFHIKDKGYLGEGKVNVPAAVRAIRDIGYDGFLILETSAPSGNVEADLRRQFEYLRSLIV